MAVVVSRHVDIDAGHRVARHESKCSNLHGHRYRLTVHVSGPVREDGSPEHGMVIDFGRIKDALMRVHDEWDHRLLIGADDPLLAVLRDLPGVVIVPVQPTAENLSRLALELLAGMLAPLDVVAVEMRETASCSAVAAP